MRRQSLAQGTGKFNISSIALSARDFRRKNKLAQGEGRSDNDKETASRRLFHQAQDKLRRSIWFLASGKAEASVSLSTTSG
jgi:hypothetical protein